MTRFMDELMAELIPYGGVAVPRSLAYSDALARTGDEQAAERMAFAPEPLDTPEALAQWIPLDQAIQAGMVFSN